MTTKLLSAIYFLFLLFNLNHLYAQKTITDDKVVLVIHGGAGTILQHNMSAEKERAFKTAVMQSLKAGYEALMAGSSSVEAVEKAIIILEDSPLFNAGKGAVFTHHGKNELDASIMYGKNGMAGAIAGVRIIKNPISAAIAVMNKSEHVMMISDGAEQFAKSQGLQLVDPSYFFTQDRYNGLQKVLERDAKKMELDHDQVQSNTRPEWIDEKFGTVGCVALDQHGDLAAGTSTGGMTNKKFGRVGDAPVIGAGTYANEQVGISCTGWGEYYIRNVAAYDVAALMNYKGMSVADATKEVIRKIGVMGGDGGMIALDKDGNVAMPFNTAGMYRGYVTANGKFFVELYN